MELVEIEEKVIHGLSIRTNNAKEMSPNEGKIPALWQNFDAKVPVDYQHGERVYGVYFDYESDHNGDFSVLAGFDGKRLPDDVTLESITIPAGTFLVFVHKGQMPQIAIDAWTEVWQYFSADSPMYSRLHSTDFEYYLNAEEIHVHIAVNPR